MVIPTAATAVVVAALCSEKRYVLIDDADVMRNGFVAYGADYVLSYSAVAD